MKGLLSQSGRAAWRLFRDAGGSWLADYAPSMGAALAYYTLFSIAPLLLIVISVAGLAFGQQAARGEIIGQLSQLMGPESAQMVNAMLLGLNRPDAGVMGTVFGVVALLVGATSVFAELQDALDRIWRAPARPPASGLAGLWRVVRVRLLSLGMVLGIGFLLTVSLLVSAALAALGKWWGPWFDDYAVLANGLNFALSFGLVSAIFAMIYKWMPRVRVAWRDVWLGAAITALLFTLGKSLIGLYIGRSGVASAFGAAASLVVLLLWVYWSAQIFLLGAEFTWVYAHRHGSLRGQPPRPVGPVLSRQIEKEKTMFDDHYPSTPSAANGGGADVPQPAPDVVPLPTPSHPVPPIPDTPPEIIEPPMPEQHPPVRDPVVPTDTLQALR